MNVREKLVELSIEDAILILREEYRQRTDGYTTYLEHGGKGVPAEEVSLDALAMVISALEKIKWIPVTERLPQKDGHYLVTINYFGNRQSIDVRYFAKDGETVDKYDFAGQKDVWCSYDSEWGYVSTDSVTHWMSLPELPKEENT